MDKQAKQQVLVAHSHPEFRAVLLTVARQEQSAQREPTKPS